MPARPSRSTCTGPLCKGANVCHGTAGNGYAFLALLERTGGERGLERARAFEMHAAAQVERSRSDRGRGRYTLWTGDLGSALFLADCIDGEGRPPLREETSRDPYPASVALSVERMDSCPSRRRRCAL